MFYSMKKLKFNLFFIIFIIHLENNFTLNYYYDPESENWSQPSDDYINTDNIQEFNKLKIVANFIRAFKFYGTDYRYRKSDNIFLRQFPSPPLESLNFQIEIACKLGIKKCLDIVYEYIDQNFLITNDECFKERDNYQESMLQFTTKVTAFYYLCWYTLLENPLLEHLDFVCDNTGSCNPTYFCLNSDIPFACARHSFCPDFCCGYAYMHLKFDDCNNLELKCQMSKENPCTNLPQTAPSPKCEIKSKQNRDFNSLINGNVNYTCQCKDATLHWSTQYLQCSKKNKCDNNELEKCGPNEVCIDTVERYLCLCEWSYRKNTMKDTCFATMNLSASNQDN